MSTTSSRSNKELEDAERSDVEIGMIIIIIVVFTSEILRFCNDDMMATLRLGKLVKKYRRKKGKKCGEKKENG